MYNKCNQVHKTENQKEQFGDFVGKKAIFSSKKVYFHKEHTLNDMGECEENIQNPPTEEIVLK